MGKSPGLFEDDRQFKIAPEQMFESIADGEQFERADDVKPEKIKKQAEFEYENNLGLTVDKGNMDIEIKEINIDDS